MTDEHNHVHGNIQEKGSEKHTNTEEHGDQKHTQ